MEKVELIFKTLVGSTYDETFAIMKEYQNAGMAGKNSKILFNDVEVPAGYYDTCEDSFRMYNALVIGDLEEIKHSLPVGATESEIFAMESSIAKSYQHLHETELSPEYLDSLISEAKTAEATTK